MNVAVTINDTYFYPLYIMLNTLFSKHEGAKVHVYLIHSRVGLRNRERLKRLCKKYGGSFTEIFVSEQEFAEAPSFSYFTKEMYYRILVARLLPKTLDRVLYLDPDIIVTDNLEEFYSMPLGDCFFAGIRDRLQDKEDSPYWKELGFTGKNRYINSGVLLCNLKVLRQEQKEQDVFAMLKERGERLKFPDQDLINVLYEGRIAVTDDRYNLNPNILRWWEYLGYNFAPFLMKKPAIIHYMGSGKPWRSSYTGGMYQYYWNEERKYAYGKKVDMFFRFLKIPFLMIKSGIAFFIS
ncbi:MAG: glycosyltransferase family 8 protein [Roseburia sp.]|nr:glycosyltransferase family 8 protein [Roseburia sp.]MCM1277917.1 glycosyltransferase family 8 protein [Robinsoniella sp.]